MKPVDAEKGLSRVGGHEEKTRAGSSTPTPESTTVGPVCPRESQEKEGGGEGTKVTVYEGVEGSIRSIAERDGGQAGQSSNKGVPHDKATTLEHNHYESGGLSGYAKTRALRPCKESRVILCSGID